MKFRLVLVTTARSDYSTMYPVMKASQNHSDIESIVFCGGMHLLPEFGETYRQLEEDGFTIHEKVHFMSVTDDPMSLPESLATGTLAFAKALQKWKPDFVLVSGDRIENLALYNATTSLKIPIAHMCGGDITEGAFDNQVRHSMTKLSHLHFVSMEEHARRVRQMGEEPWRITLTGDAAIDTIKNFKAPTREKLAEMISVPLFGSLVISTFHPLTLGSEDFVSQYRNMLNVLIDVDATPILSYPNIDPGFKPLIELLEDFKNKRPDAIIRKSFKREEYYALLSHCKFMIGNSSSGLWEAPSFALPVVNIGSRQAGRMRGDNVIDVSGFSISELRSAVARASSEEFRRTLSHHNPYGDGKAAELTLKTLLEAPRGDKLLVKKFHEIYDA